MSFDTRDELGHHSRQQHATITESKGDSKENARNPAMEERIQARIEEKGKGETAQSLHLVLVTWEPRCLLKAMAVQQLQRKHMLLCLMHWVFMIR
jgi:hypothetical protein